MRFLIRMLEIMPITRHNHRNVELATQFLQSLIDLALYIPTMSRHRMPMVLHLEIIPVTKDRFVPLSDPFCLVIAIVAEIFTEFTTRTSRQDDQPFIVFLKQLVIDARLVVDAFEIGSRRELHEIFVALIVHRKDRQVVASLILRRITIVPRARRNVRLHAKDWLDVSFFCRLIKINHPTHRAMVSDRTRLHTKLFRLVDELLDLCQSIQQTVVRVIVQMHIIRRFERYLFIPIHLSQYTTFRKI